VVRVVYCDLPNGFLDSALRSSKNVIKDKTAMFKKAILPTLSAFIMTTAFAGGPDAYHHNMNHFFIGVNGGATINLSSLEGRYVNDTNSTTAEFRTSSSDASFATGGLVGYAFSISPKNEIALVGGVSYNFSDIKQTWNIDSNTTPNTEAYNILQDVEPQWQYDAYFRFTHFICDNFSIHANVGFSAADAKVKLAIHDNGVQAGDTAGPGRSEEHGLYGAILGFGGDYYVTPHSSITAEFDYHLYASQNLNTAEDTDTGAIDRISSRKVQLSIPSLLVGYTYHF